MERPEIYTDLHTCINFKSGRGRITTQWRKDATCYWDNRHTKQRKTKWSPVSYNAQRWISGRLYHLNVEDKANKGIHEM